jgi:guanylate kinase
MPKVTPVAKRTHPVWLLIAGPSGVGKTTLVEGLQRAHPDEVVGVVTATTRARRPEETEGVQYFFLSTEEFAKREKAGEFLETIERNQVRYGTLKSEILKKLGAGKNLVMHIDWRGSRKIREFVAAEKNFEGAVVGVFVRPPSLEALRERLVRRARNTPAEIEARLKAAREDLEHAGEFDFSFQSGTPAEDAACAEKIYRKMTGR